MAGCRMANFLLDMDEIIGQAEFNFLKDKIAHNMAYNGIHAKSFNNLKYKRMIIRIANLHYGKTNYAEIARSVNRSPERIRQILAKFYRRMRFIIEKERL